MSTTRLPLFLDRDHRHAAAKRHPRLWKRVQDLSDRQADCDEDEFYRLEDEKNEILKKMGLD